MSAAAGGMSSGITVAVRLRPFNQREVRLNCTNIVSMPSRSKVLVAQVRNGKVCEQEKPREFNFDDCFWTHDARPADTIGADGSSGVGFADQQAVFDRIGEPCVRAVLDGFNACLFAYGQTGSGKTYTMMGYQQDPGLIPRMSAAVFAAASDGVVVGGGASSSGDGATLMSFECSYMEIYNERVIDLLDSSGRGATEALRVRQHPSTGVFVEGLRKFAVATDDEVLQLIADGDRRRTVAATNMNSVSSRSHAILIIYVSQTRTDASGSTTGKSARMSLVDLAGSERVSSTGAEGDTLLEGASINKSLTVLGMCLARLAEASEMPGGKASLPIPFRDSNLTFILNESLGGNSKTTMLAAISPADVNAEETVSTLRFAQVTKRVKTKPVVNENPNAKVIRELREELAKLREKLAALAASSLTPTATSPTNADGVDARGALELQIEESTAAIEAEEAASPPLLPPSLGHAQHTTCIDTPAPPTGAIYLDWSRPNLINASPTALTPVLALSPGKNFLQIDNPRDADSFVSFQQPPPLSFSSASGALRPEAPTSTPTIELEYLTVRQEVTLHAPDGRLSDLISVNGSHCSARHVLLAHNDRLVIGAVVLRLAHPSSLASARDFSCCPSTSEHLALLEELHRKLICIDEHRQYLLEFGITDDDDADEENTSALAESDDRLTMLSHEKNVLEGELAALYPVTGDELRRTTAATAALQLTEAESLLDDMRMASTCATTTLTLVALSELIGSYDAAIEEREAAIAAQKKMITELRKTLQGQLRRQQANYRDSVPKSQMLSTERFVEGNEGEAAAPQDDGGAFGSDAQSEGVGSADELEASAVHVAMEEELQWHSAVINLRQFKPHGPLDDPAATAIWTRVAFGDDASKKPFFKEIKQRQIAAFQEMQEERDRRQQELAMLSGSGDKSASLEREDSSPLQRRISSMLILSPWRPLHLASMSQQQEPGQGNPTAKFSTEGALWRSGPFYKLSQNSEKWEQRYALISDKFLYYFYECDGTQRAIAAIYLYGATFTLSTKQVAKRDHCILLTTTTPRRVSDGRSSYYLSFRSAQDRLMWCHWIAEASVPPIPRSMASRLRDELDAGRRNGSITIEQIERNPELGKFFYIPVSEWGFADLAHVKEVSDDKRSHMNWDADETVTNCTQCKQAFTFFRRRHHCRACGRIFCSSCTKDIPMRNEKGETKPKRACQECANSNLRAVAGAAVPTPQGLHDV